MVNLPRLFLAKINDMATKPLSRKHHYVSQGYLAAFTAAGEKNDLFYVHEVNNGHRFRTSPANVAGRRDFNQVDVKGHSPDAVENALSGFEGDAIDAIR